VPSGKRKRGGKGESRWKGGGQAEFWNRQMGSSPNRIRVGNDRHCGRKVMLKGARREPQVPAKKNGGLEERTQRKWEK